MARPVTGHQMPQSQQGGTEEPAANVSVLQQEGQANATRGNAIADYNLDVDCKPEGSDSDMKAIDKEKENSAADYAKMELSQARTLHQRTMNCKVVDRIKRLHQA